MNTIKPATPLPWKLAGDPAWGVNGANGLNVAQAHQVTPGPAGLDAARGENAAYIVHAANELPKLEAENARPREELRELVALATVMARESADRVHNGDDCIDPARALLRELWEAE